MLEYAHENGCPWDGNERIFKFAVDQDNLEILKYLHKNGY